MDLCEMAGKDHAMAKFTLIAEPGSQEYIYRRQFDFAQADVFKAYTDPLLIPKWWGPSICTTMVDKMDVRPGGLWRFVQTNLRGVCFGFHGVFHTVEPYSLLINTLEYEGKPGNVSLNTVTFKAGQGETELIRHAVFQSEADRDLILNYNMEQGLSQSMDRLEALLQNMHP